MAFSGHRPVPAKSTVEAAEAAGDLPTWVGLSPGRPGPVQLPAETRPSGGLTILPKTLLCNDPNNIHTKRRFCSQTHAVGETLHVMLFPGPRVQRLDSPEQRHRESNLSLGESLWTFVFSLREELALGGNPQLPRNES